ncbi:GLPGLI family protein [Jiulongibacter sediminis]|uniref:GLPGLI family protein n=1 Tax=Jiulongibacter sediminis TaxID=1605367 RepID=A0A0P7BDJ4_9BACT|nr:GLPGLI family protein [Jiulongibacter sediminis]KPM48795.1 hypothetical protein AFM12_09470 [Jiulongibacter sediminis]TBX25327.1 hypothetical protein TK44_09475 [Jiulongibacter sediminis]
MKKLLILLLCSSALFAQKTGAIYYTETMKLQLPDGPDNEAFRQLMPTSRDMFKVLYYNENESLFRNEQGKNEDLEIRHEEDGNDFEMIFGVPETNVYTNLKNNQLLQYQEFMGKEFLIVDKLNTRKWKLDAKQKKVLGFDCQKATLIDTTQQVIAWFTPQIPISVGPNGYSGLPGMVLAIEVDNGQRMLTATKMEDLPAGFAFEKPSEGKKVNRNEFEKIRDEKMKEMGAKRGAGGNVMMIIEERD